MTTTFGQQIRALNYVLCCQIWPLLVQHPCLPVFWFPNKIIWHLQSPKYYYSNQYSSYRSRGGWGPGGGGVSVNSPMPPPNCRSRPLWSMQSPVRHGRITQTRCGSASCCMGVWQACVRQVAKGRGNLPRSAPLDRSDGGPHTLHPQAAERYR